MPSLPFTRRKHPNPPAEVGGDSPNHKPRRSLFSSHRLSLGSRPRPGKKLTESGPSDSTKDEGVNDSDRGDQTISGKEIHDSFTSTESEIDRQSHKSYHQDQQQPIDTDAAGQNGIDPVEPGIHIGPYQANKILSQIPAKPTKQLILNAFVEPCSGHQSPGLWKHPEDKSMNFNSIHHWTELAQSLEKAKFHGIFIADVLGGYDVYRGPKNLAPAIASGAQWPVNEPLSMIPAMAAVTHSIGFGVTVSTSYEQPYHLARRLSTVDHLTGGRVGWNVVTSYLDSAARNLTNGQPQAEHDERYAICEEFMSVAYKLWNSSWRSDAVKLDAKSGIYTDPALVREINHRGKHFQVPGPHLCQPSPQRTPVIMQAGTSRAGKAFAAKHAEAIFVSTHSIPGLRKTVADIRQLAATHGRDPQSIKVLNKLCVVLGKTQAEADAKFAEYVEYGDHEGALALFGGWTGIDMAPYGDDEELREVDSNAIKSYITTLISTPPTGGAEGDKWTKKSLARWIATGGLGAKSVGTPAKVADEMQRWIDETDIDGFNIAYAVFPGTFEDVAESLVPELRRRGMFWDDYAVPGGTYRENLYARPGQAEPLDDHPAAKYIWRQGQSPVFDESESQTVPEGVNLPSNTENTHVDRDEDSLDPVALQLS